MMSPIVPFAAWLIPHIEHESAFSLSLRLLSFVCMAPQKIVLKVSSMSDERVKQKAMETVADIYGIDSIAADHKDQKMTVIGDMDTVTVAKKLKKFGRIDIVSVGPAKEEKKDDKKVEKK
ncbi:heavy metal-associated isoprenylated plant protein 39 isoform X3 [Brachypodium distachyon]|uniref:HMA domain-containing protein n=1 Tax=Brachypodium distachyon TaxID=15368 RepID=A0A0Q3EBP2_BRADI|nr:heavy metal-associated isoprenylated plant protein 39 isoform X3 [Brachypodium distachyon]KQJ83772.1 hypothetical protein BRADI_5g16787v3 [Brachypodium distachyon]PNT61564.1 hypothetical protein BRADI_5g16787v3 [Brachypodium distachyon]|eukprot:XP_003580221.2 heavy metal-associated isoprenylated plant protein 39 isoform X3 [Brachypodium distachyon]